jgi:hypothetical protein
MVCQEWEAALQHEEQREIKSGRRKADEQRHVSAIMGPGVSGAGDLSDDGRGVIAWFRGSFKVGRTNTHSHESVTPYSAYLERGLRVEV